jgi:transcriptional regulator with XRE-family HTH domain
VTAARWGKTLAKIRSERQLTQEELARRLGVSVTTVSRWERGAMVPSILVLEPLCRTLGVRCDTWIDLPLRSVERYYTDPD